MLCMMILSPQLESWNQTFSPVVLTPNNIITPFVWTGILHSIISRKTGLKNKHLEAHRSSIHRCFTRNFGISFRCPHPEAISQSHSFGRIPSHGRLKLQNGWLKNLNSWILFTSTEEATQLLNSMSFHFQSVSIAKKSKVLSTQSIWRKDMS